MARVLLVSDSPYISTGLANVARTIGYALHNAGHTVYHSAFSDPRTNQETIKYGGRAIPWRVLQTQKDHPQDYLTGCLSFNRHFLTANPDLVITVADPWNCAHYILYAPCPTIMMLHVEAEPIPIKIDSHGPKINLLQIIAAASTIVTAGPFGRSTIQRRLLELAKTPPEKSELEITKMLTNSSLIIPDGIDTSVFRPLANTNLKSRLFKGISDDTFVVGYFGRQNPRKGLPYVLEAFANWKNRPKNTMIYLHTALQDKIGWNVPALLHDLGIGESAIIDPHIKVGSGCTNEVLNALYNACFVAGTPIRTSTSYTPIEDIKKGDLVYSAKGNIREVLATSKRQYRGTLVTVKTSRNHTDLTCTSNHPFLVYDGKTIVQKEAGKLELGDMIVSPINLMNRDPKHHLIQQETLLKKERKDSAISRDKDGNFFIKARHYNVYLPVIEVDKVQYIISVVEELNKFKDNVTVYNFEVQEDHSYIANGLGVKNCDITVLPSTGEGAGLTVLESISAGTPAITTDYAEAPNYVRGIAELIKPVGFWVEPVTNFRRAIPDVHQVTKELQKAYDMRKGLPSIGEKGRKHIIENYDVSIISKQWIDLVGRFKEKQKTRLISIPDAYVDKKKVMFVGSYFLPDLLGGGEITWLKILQKFREHGWQPYVYIARSDIQKEEIIDIDGINIIRNNRTGFEKKIHDHIMKIKPNVVMTTLIDPKLTQVALQLSKEVGAISVYYEQFYNTITKNKYVDVMNLKPENMAPWGKEILGLSDLVYVNGEFLHKVVKKYHDIDTHILHPYINLEEVKVKSNTKRYVTMINPDPGKGGDTAAYMAKHMPDVEFLFVKVSCTQKYENIPNLPNITVWEFQKDVSKIYEQTKVILMPTVVDETFGRVIVEAQSNGIPIIGRDVGNIGNTMGAGGILLDRLDDDDVWCEALRTILTDTAGYERLSQRAIENVKRFDFNKELDDFYTKVSTFSAPGSSQRKVAVITPNYPGVLEVFNMAQKLWTKQIGLLVIEGIGNGNRIMNVVKKMEPETIIFGAHMPIFEDLMEQLHKDMPKVRLISSWFSNFSQMEYSPNNELGLLAKTRKKLEDGIIQEIWFSGKDTGLSFNQQNPNMKYMPCPINIHKEQPSLAPEKDKVRISLFCTPGPRKNISAQIAAVAQIPNAELHINGFTQQQQYKDLLDLMKIKYVDHGWLNKSDYLKLVASMDIGLQVTFAETFNYVAVEHLMQGVPIIGSDMVAVLNMDPELRIFQVDQADSPSSIAAKIKEVISNREKYSQLAQDAIKRISEHNNNALKEMLGI